MMADQCISVGARDRTARLWKVIDETQLVFRGDSSKKEEYQNNTIDCVAVIPPTHFVTGSDSGSLSLWSIHKKKPLFTVPLAHGLDPIPPLEELSPENDMETAAHNARFLRQTPRGITALATVPGTDIILSGSWDGWIRAWQVSEDKKTITPLGPVGAGSTIVPTTPSMQLKQTLASDGVPSSDAMMIDGFDTGASSTHQNEAIPLLKGVVNDIAVFERRPETTKTGAIPKLSKKQKKSMKEASSSSSSATFEARRGLCIVAALGKEHRFGRWNCFGKNHFRGPTSQGRNGAVVLEVSFSANVDPDRADEEEEEDDVMSNGGV